MLRPGAAAAASAQRATFGCARDEARSVLAVRAAATVERARWPRSADPLVRVTMHEPARHKDSNASEGSEDSEMQEGRRRLGTVAGDAGGYRTWLWHLRAARSVGAL